MSVLGRSIGSEGHVYYGGIGLNRASAQRGDSERIGALLTAAGTAVIPMWRDNCLIRDTAPVTITADRAGHVLAAASDLVLLGLDGGAAVFAADLSAFAEADVLALVGADATADTRSLVASRPRAEVGLFGYARGILHWHRNQRFCGTCGGPSDPAQAGHLRICRDCGKLLFPRIEPAVIVLVELPGEPGGAARCLLGRHAGAGPDDFSTLAGFVEIGENLEDAVRREVMEEAGVAVGEVSYRGSQAWPFPAGMMVGFRGLALSDAIDVDAAELVEARWFTAAEIRARIAGAGAGGPYRTDSIGKVLIEEWLAEQG